MSDELDYRKAARDIMWCGFEQSAEMALREFCVKVRSQALRDLASAVKKVCPEVVSQIIAAAHPEEEFIEFLRSAP